MPGHTVAELTVRNYVHDRKRTLGLLIRETYVAQSYTWGGEAQVDWYEAYADLAGELTKLQVFCMRSMASGGAFHRAYRSATQQAFLEGHELAFRHFGGVFRLLRYDNLTSAVRKVLRGRLREETERFIALRSHWHFEADFCTPGAGHEKGGVEGENGYFRRNHWVPVPKAASLEDATRTRCRTVARPCWRATSMKRPRRLTRCRRVTATRGAGSSRPTSSISTAGATRCCLGSRR